MSHQRSAQRRQLSIDRLIQHSKLRKTQLSINRFILLHAQTHRMYVDLPPMLGPVTMTKRLPSRLMT